MSVIKTGVEPASPLAALITFPTELKKAYRFSSVFALLLARILNPDVLR